MVPLVFLARPARAGIVAPQLSGTGFATGARGGANRRDASRLRGSVAARLAIAIELARSAFHDPAHHGLWRWRRRVAWRRLDVKDHRHDRALDAITKLVEHLERFVLVLDERIALPISTQTDPFTEVLHLGQGLHPLPVDRLQHHALLDQWHYLNAKQLDLLVVSVRGSCVQVVGERLAAALHHLFRNLRARRDRQVSREVPNKRIHVPSLGGPALS